MGHNASNMIKDIPYIRSIMFVSRTAPVRYERAGLLGKIGTATGIVRGMSGYMAEQDATQGELAKWQRKQNVLRCDMALSELWRHYTAFLADGYAAEKARGQAFLQARLNEQIAIHEKNIRNAKEWRAREIADWDRSAKYFQIDETHRDDPRWASYYGHVDAKAARRLQQRAEGVKQYDDLIATNEVTIEKLRAGDHSLQVGADHQLYTLERVMGDARETLAEYGGLDAGELDEAFAETERDAELHDMEAKVAEAPPVAVTDAPAPEPKSDAVVTDVLDLTGVDLRMDGAHLRPVDWHDPRVKTFDVWVRGNGTGKVRVFSGVDLDGVVVDFGDVEVTLQAHPGRKGWHFANLTAAQVKEIRG